MDACLLIEVGYPRPLLGRCPVCYCHASLPPTEQALQSEVRLLQAKLVAAEGVKASLASHVKAAVQHKAALAAVVQDLAIANAKVRRTTGWALFVAVLRGPVKLSLQLLVNFFQIILQKF